MFEALQRRDNAVWSEVHHIADQAAGQVTFLPECLTALMRDTKLRVRAKEASSLEELVLADFREGELSSLVKRFTRLDKPKNYKSAASLFAKCMGQEAEKNPAYILTNANINKSEDVPMLLDVSREWAESEWPEVTSTINVFVVGFVSMLLIKFGNDKAEDDDSSTKSSGSGMSKSPVTPRMDKATAKRLEKMLNSALRQSRQSSPNIDLLNTATKDRDVEKEALKAEIRLLKAKDSDKSGSTPVREHDVEKEALKKEVKRLKAKNAAENEALKAEIKRLKSKEKEGLRESAERQAATFAGVAKESLSGAIAVHLPPRQERPPKMIL